MCPNFNQKKLYEAEKGRPEKNMRLEQLITKYRKSKSLVDILSSDYTPYSTVGIAYLISIQQLHQRANKSIDTRSAGFEIDVKKVTQKI